MAPYTESCVALCDMRVLLLLPGNRSFPKDIVSVYNERGNLFSSTVFEGCSLFFCQAKSVLWDKTCGDYFVLENTDAVFVCQRTQDNNCYNISILKQNFCNFIAQVMIAFRVPLVVPWIKL